MRTRRLFPVSLALVVVLCHAAAGLAAEGTPDLKTYFASDFTDMEYQQKTHTAVGKAWQRPAQTPERGTKTVVIVTILRDGSLLEARIHLKSGLEAWDESGLAAVKAATLGPLPKSYKRTSVEVHFHFEYN